MTARKLFSVLAGASALTAAVAVSGDVDAQPYDQQTQDAARSFAQAARGAADAADDVADSDIDTDATAKSPKDPLARAQEGVVVLERRGRVLGVGTVLDGDGRILTALSPLGHGNHMDARFADGSLSQVKIGHADRGWDLALLIPQNGRWKKGLKASGLAPSEAGTQLRAFSVLHNKKLAPARTIVRGKKTLLGGDSELLRDALQLASRFQAKDIGSPIVDDNGDVVAVIARACAPSKQEICSPVPFGVPVSAVKAFLRTVPANAVPPAPWLGIQGVAEDAGPVRGVRVLGVHPKSPAAAAGLKGGSDPAKADVIAGVDGKPVTTPEALADAINRRAVGDTIQLLLYGGGQFRQVSLTLRAAPDTARVVSPKRKLSPSKRQIRQRRRPKNR